MIRTALLAALLLFVQAAGHAHPGHDTPAQGVWRPRPGSGRRSSADQAGDAEGEGEVPWSNGERST